MDATDSHGSLTTYEWRLRSPGYYLKPEQAEAFLDVLLKDDTETILNPAVASKPGELSVIFNSDLPSSIPYVMAWSVQQAIPDLVGKRVSASLQVVSDTD